LSSTIGAATAWAQETTTTPRKITCLEWASFVAIERIIVTNTRRGVLFSIAGIFRARPGRARGKARTARENGPFRWHAACTLVIMRKIVAALGLLLSCKRQAPPPPAPTPSAAVVDAAPAPSSSAAEVEPHDPLKDLARQWSDAINKGDIAALGAMHGSTVRFYGVSVDNKMYCAKMKAALDKDPSFHQDIAALRVEWPSSTRAKVSFRKKDNKAEHPSYLVMEQNGELDDRRRERSRH
jgi:hypothetical protein